MEIGGVNYSVDRELSRCELEVCGMHSEGSRDDPKSLNQEGDIRQPATKYLRKDAPAYRPCRNDEPPAAWSVSDERAMEEPAVPNHHHGSDASEMDPTRGRACMRPRQ